MATALDSGLRMRYRSFLLLWMCVVFSSFFFHIRIRNHFRQQTPTNVKCIHALLKESPENLFINTMHGQSSFPHKHMQKEAVIMDMAALDEMYSLKYSYLLSICSETHEYTLL